MALSTPTSNGSRRFNPLPSPGKNETPRSVGMVRPILPQKSVTTASIDDAYVSFILYCNPAVPLETDTFALKEAFRTPPKSEGKSFSTFALFELIKKLHSKELKTWAELALKLGVEPPDHDKGQSSQKIQQYAVRLKRWMHSMHINAFFDYLMDNPHPYWTQIPTDPNPVCEDGRDGVAAEDDMALRALLPHIRPRRGRKRPEEDGFSKSPSQRPRLESPAFGGEPRTARPDSLDPWTAHPDGRNSFMFPSVDPRSSVLPETNSAFPWSNDVSREPMSAYPQSAMTPSTRGTFWGDTAEPRSAISPKTKALGRRHGAKVVSSAWRSGGVSTSGRPRGRPPTNRPTDSPLSAIPDERREFQGSLFEQSAPQSSITPTPMLPPESVPKAAGPTSAPTSAPVTTPTSALGNRPTRPGRLSLQVPERASGPVRLATPPPPVVMVNGKSPVNGNGTNGGGKMADTPGEDAFTVFDRTSAMFTATSTDDHGSSGMHFDPNDSDRTNCDEIEAMFVADILEGAWYDEKGQLGPPADVDEAMALVKVVIEGISKQALTKEAFLINLSALAGVKYMMKAGSTSVQRAEVGPDYTKYHCAWGLRYGPISGKFRLTETVPHSRWKKGAQPPDERREKADIPAEGEEAAEFWRRRYADLLRVVNKRSEDTTRVAKEPQDNERS
ncbi:ARS binding protein 2-domain-containing protein [Annulohypoxylon maeteangense]|uniref:ARS binding protein 2-domain-containing protein n=1 Tax=Annulohypoxylon maeteangense TaxID=1927788 RepID=UPI002007FCEE|nr:ARS binding protein 2-domain-containing protein [Annulohypoxylon maeteangense]KAI0884496.1 ARS binding protein 2-domain-containing protein [Annulohypoxylon maeteangense]